MVEEEGEEKKEGISCRTCGCKHFYTIWTRPRKKGIVRSRECRNCGRRITTRETEEKNES